jgi:dTDP-glucose 4,6-dehydratase
LENPERKRECIVYDPKEDLEHILKYTFPLWGELAGKKIFLTGGTGFFGVWLLRSFLYASERFGLGSTVTVLSRDPEGFLKKFPIFAKPSRLSFIKGDVRDFDFPHESFDYVIHGAATSAEATYRGEDALEKFDTVAHGTRRVLEMAACRNVRKFLYISSGSVYGPQTDGRDMLDEEYNGAPPVMDSEASALGEGKRVAEMFCSYYAEKYDMEIKIARCFTFIGPYLQLDIHYAAGNFIKDAIEKKKIEIFGDGLQERSYMYAADLMIWLWTILLKGKSQHPYNVGSEHSVKLVELAEIVAKCAGDSIEIEILNRGSAPKTAAPGRYIPSTARARDELALIERVDLRSAVCKSVAFAAETKREGL